MPHTKSDEVSDDPTARVTDPWPDRVARLSTEARAWVVLHPFAAAAVAVATGFVLGRLARRWS